MLFNSLDFAIFLPIVFSLYWLLNRKPIVWQNTLLLVASYVFYGWWDYRFLGLIFLSTLVDFWAGLKIQAATNRFHKRLFLAISLGVNLGMLAYFKYANFFIENFVEAFQIFGRPLSADSLSIILPVGISFYTFQTLSYTLDIYFRKTKPTHHFIDFAAFVSFFPQLVAGPIERASQLLPQFSKKRSFDPIAATDGLRQILWGLFKKMVIADNAAILVSEVFAQPEAMNASALALGIIFFAFQIYGDFSGYSDIAIGTARLLGFSLMQNFAFPYFSRDIAEFWRRWHISLSTWFRDYLYIPLGGSRGTKFQVIRNTFVIFLVSGFWHGANWTFVMWGFLHALFFLPLLLAKRNRRHIDTVGGEKNLPGLSEVIRMFITFGLVTFSWIFFRAASLPDAFLYIEGLLSPTYFERPPFTDLGRAFVLLITLTFMLLMEWFGRHNRHALERFGINFPLAIRWGSYALIFFLILMLHPSEASPFIYFQF